MGTPRATEIDDERASAQTTGQRGQSVVEVTMFVPILCLILFGIVQFGSMIGTYMDLTSATRDAARRAVDSRNENNPDQTVQDAFDASLDTTAAQDVSVAVDGTWAQDEQITVTSTLPYELDVMGVVVWNGNLTARSIVRIG